MSWTNPGALVTVTGSPVTSTPSNTVSPAAASGASRKPSLCSWVGKMLPCED
ncbi:MAG: hypothetical protein J0M04_11260 [Verrucomicrobia bacterium]|nr:hypothetical protein [Verrucomicrobiota bacterium]